MHQKDCTAGFLTEQGGSPPSEAWLFAQQLLGRPLPNPAAARAEAQRKRELLVWLASISTEHENQLRQILDREARQAAERKRLEWLAQISTEHEAQLRRLQAAEAQAREAQHRFEQFVARSELQEAQWDPAEHPRRGGPPNAGWFSATGGDGGSGAPRTKVNSPAPAKTVTHDVDGYVAKVPRKRTPATTPASQYEITHTGPYNYTISGGGAKFDIDGYRGSTILEAKHVDKPNSSPYVPGSTCPDTVRDEVLRGVDREFHKIRTIIESGETPFKSVEIITNNRDAQALFRSRLNDARVPGTVRLKP